MIILLNTAHIIHHQLNLVKDLLQFDYTETWEGVCTLSHTSQNKFWVR